MTFFSCFWGLFWGFAESFQPLNLRHFNGILHVTIFVTFKMSNNIKHILVTIFVTRFFRVPKTALFTAYFLGTHPFLRYIFNQDNLVLIIFPTFTHD